MTPKAPTYITLDRLAQMVREGREFEVVDAKTGETSRARCSPRSSSMRKRAAATMLPINFLKQLIGLYGNSMQNFVPQYLEAAMDAFQRNQSAAKDAFSGNVLRRYRQAQHGDVRGCRARRSRGKPKAEAEAEQQRRRSTEGRACRASGQSRPAEPLTDHAFSIAAALALAAASSLNAQAPSATSDTATPIAGNWTYAATAGGSEATFANAAGSRS